MLQLQLQLQSYTVQRNVLRGIMQCYRLVGKDGSSALIGTVGVCRAVSGGQMEVCSTRQEPRRRNFAGQWWLQHQRRVYQHLRKLQVQV